MHYKQIAMKLCVMLTVLLTGLALKGCGDSGPSSGPSTSLKIAVVYNPSQAAQLTQREVNIASMRVDVSGPGFASTTGSAPYNPASKQIDININAPAGSDRTIYIAALDAANQLVFSGSVSGVTIPASGPIPITVVLPFRVVINKQGGGSGTVTPSPSGFACGANCFDFDGGTSVTLTASADSGSVFAGWSGGGCSGTGPCTVNTDATIAAILNAAVGTATVTVTKTGSGTGTVTSTPSGIACGASCSASFAGGTSVTLTAAGNGGSTFAGWSGACSGTGSCVVVTNSNQLVNAQFDPAALPTTLSVNKTGTGTVTSTPAGIDCGGTCSAPFASSSTVTLTATPTGGSTFAGWAGACSGTGPCVVVMNGTQTVAANFTAAPTTLTINKTGTGTGIVTSNPAGINCGTTCGAGFAVGTEVTLTASPTAGSTFAGWSGPCSGTGSCIVVMNTGQTVTATFTASPTTATLTVTKAGAGTGTVTSSPAGINCGNECSNAYSTSTTVTLTASAASGSVFAGWSGPCSGTGSCIVVMNTGQTVTATFAASPTTATLTVTKAGAGTGSVISSPAGINCGDDCSNAYNAGTTVTLSASPAGGSIFSGWNGACSGTGSCVVVVNGDQNVAATFSPPTMPTLTVNKTGTGTGTVTSAPVGVNCGTSCSNGYASGTSVTLTATAAAGSTFAGWSGGGCSGTGTCVTVMSGDQTVVAQFNSTPSTNTLTVNKSGNGAGTVTSSPSGINCGAVCTFAFTTGTTVTLTATPSAGSEFDDWNGSGCNGDGTCVVTMTQNRSVTARFDD